MRVVVTGGAGFIGNNLVRRLLAANHEVLVVDNSITANKSVIDPRVSYLAEDVVDADWLEDARLFRPDLIYHLACQASPPAYQTYPLHTVMTCVNGTDNALKLAKQFGARMLFTSTSEVYGDPVVHPQHEDYRGCVNTWGPRACYDEGKRVAETLCYEYARKGVDIRVVRVFNTYGPYMDPKDGRVVSNFINQALRGEPLTIYGTGYQTRSFCYVDDLLAGFDAVMSAQREMVSSPTNLGNPYEFTVNRLAEQVLTFTGSSSTIEYRELPVDDPRQRQPDIAKASGLGWRPVVDLKTGLRRTIEYFRSLL